MYLSRSHLRRSFVPHSATVTARTSISRVQDAMIQVIVRLQTWASARDPGYIRRTSCRMRKSKLSDFLVFHISRQDSSLVSKTKLEYDG